MKKFLMLLFLSVHFLFVTVYSKPIIPKELWGFRRFSIDSPRQWNGSLIGGGYVEHHQIYNVDGLKLISTNQHAYVAKPGNTIIQSIIGNWADVNDNDWKYGFFENFVVANQKTYSYKTVSKKGNTITLKISSPADEQLIKIAIHNDTSVTIITGKEKIRLYKITNALRAAKKQDTLSFVDTHFLKVDTATIKGYLRNAPHNKPFSVLFTDVLTQKQVFYYGDVDTNGLFEVKIPLLNTTFAVLDWGRQGSGDVDAITPGESYFYYRDFKTNQKMIMGDNSQFHNEIVNYDLYGASRFTNEQFHKKSISKSLEFLDIAKTELKEATEVLNSYLINNPHATSRFRYFVTQFNRVAAGKYLMQRRFHIDSGNNRLPETFMKFVTDTIYQNKPPVPISLIREFNVFMNDYYTYIKGVKLSVNPNDIFNEMLNNDELGTTEDEKKAFLAEISINKLIETGAVKDKATPEPKLSNEQVSLIQKFKSLHGRELEKKINAKYNAFITTENEKINEGMPKGDFKEIYFAKNLFGALESNNVAFPDSVFQEALLRIKNPIFRETVIKKQDYLKQLSKVDMEYVESLKRTDHLKGAKNADSLFAALIQPYKGKVVYVDFWGTWCSPCIGEMPYVKSIKDGFTGKDVIFMYFANNSPESSWKNLINQHHLTGPNVVHYRLPGAQQSLIETRLSIQSFPTYMLIDKDGNISTMKAPRPSDGEKLIATINDMLK
jgi:thiol-disulfide isomerase/thioredoxin